MIINITTAGVRLIGDLPVETGAGQVTSFDDIKSVTALTPVQVTNYLDWKNQYRPWDGHNESLVMKGDTVVINGVTWESLINNNVWQPPVGWRQVVAVGNPAWIQPTGAHDAYNIGDRVRFQGSNYESVINANVWSPTAYPAGWTAI